MAARVEKATSMNCDAIGPDNMMVTDRVACNTCSQFDAYICSKWFAGVVHGHGMKVGLKNCLELAPVPNEYFDFVVNEECFQWNEC
ncbi:unnamed protein product, partial [Sphacelaria rigidula]